MIQRLRRGGFNVNIVGRSRMWFTISLVLIVVSIASLGIRGLNFGIEFTGGTALEFEASTNVSVTEMRDAVTEIGVENAVVQRIGDQGFLIQSEPLGHELQMATAERLSGLAGIDRDEVSITEVGPRWGQQITQRALQALALFLVVAALYMSIRLEPKMAGAGMLALVHDLVLTAGIYSLSGFVVSQATVIAILTILGYSLYDTVVIFDRVKDHTATITAAGRRTYAHAANESLNNVLVRSLNTSITSLLPVGSLLFVGSFLLGAETLRELALALFIGLAAGTYSSLFVATPFLSWWKEREAKWATLKARIAARSAEGVAGPGPARPRAQEPAAPEPAEPPEEQPAARVPATPRSPGPAAGPARRPPARPPRKKRKKKKR